MSENEYPAEEEPEGGTFADCAKNQHFMIVIRTKTSTTTLFKNVAIMYRRCKFCGGIETTYVYSKMLRNGDIIPKVETFFSTTSKQQHFNTKIFKFIGETPENWDIGDTQ